MALRFMVGDSSQAGKRASGQTGKGSCLFVTFAEKIEEFEKAQEGDAFAQRAAANLVRSFFIHGGLFLGTPKAPWLP
jgi:hypothetical protein